MFLQFETMDPQNTSIFIAASVVEAEQARALVQEYTSYFLALPPKQTVHVRIDPSALVKWEQLLQIYTSIRRFHLKHKLIDVVHLYLTDKVTVQMVRALTGIFNSSVQINIHASTDRTAPAK